MTPDYAAKIGLAIRPINVNSQKIDNFLLKIYGVVFAKFLVKDKESKDRFFKETFLLADTNIEVILRISLLSLSNADFQFDIGEFTWSSYTGRGLTHH